MKAPAAQRGGWLSAAGRLRRLAASRDTPLDASNIVKRLWIGGQPPFDRHLPFDLLVLCAREIQPASIAFQGSAIRVPLPDSALDPDELRTALGGARATALALASGKRVLVTCAQGRNRSALVAGLAMGIVFRVSAEQIVSTIRAKRRSDCLTNPHFVGYLEQFVGRLHPGHELRRKRGGSTGSTR